MSEDVTTGNPGEMAQRPQPTTHDEEEISLLDFAIVLAKYKEQILGIPIAAGVLAAILSMAMPNIYRGAAVLMPPQQDQSSAAALIGQLVGGGASSGGIGSALGLRNPNDLYVGVLKSRTISDRVIERFKLQALYGTSTLVETREELDNRSTITAGKDGLIIVEFDDDNPKIAAAVANAYVEELDKLTASLAMSEASQRRLYFQRQVDQNFDALAKADLALKAVQEKTGLIKPDDQARAIFEAVAILRGQITAKEVELSAIRTFATEKNPNYIRAQQELASMKQQLVGLERDNALGAGDILVPTGKIPAAGLEFLKRYRDVRYYETVYELLAKQLELAKIDEGKNATIIQMVDKAIEPDKKSRPKRTLIAFIVILFVGILTVFWAFLKESYLRARTDPKQGGHLQEFLQYLRYK